MNILLLDTSSGKIEFSYFSNGVIEVYEIPPDHNADMLIFYIKKIFDENEISMKEIEYVSLSNGPGSFTGLRIGSAVAKGICFVNDCKLIEINTLDIIANKSKDDQKLISLIFSNTRSSEFYFCEYERKNGKLIRLSGYQKAKIDDIKKDGFNYFINEKPDEKFKTKNGLILNDLSEISNSTSHLELTMEHIENNMFIDFATSEPFYMHDFIPKK